jgi:hypothetical protein
MSLRTLFFSIYTLLMLSIGVKAKAQDTVEAPKKVQQKILVHPNPTSYTFNLPLNVLRDTIFKMFDISSQWNDPILMRIFYFRFPEDDPKIMQADFSASVYSDPGFGDVYFKEPGTRDDIFLFDMANYWKSPIYHSNGEPFEFTSSYAIQLKAIDKNTTRITIKSIGSEIVNGTLCCNPHSPSGHYSNTQSISPTSVEEYTLILFIAEKLGIKGLPSLELPK